MLMGHCHLFPGGFGEAKRDSFGVPGTAEHLFMFMRACGFDQTLALAPNEDPAAPSVKSRIEGADSLGWLLSQVRVGTDAAAALLPAATIRPNHPSGVEKLRAARSRGVRFLKIHPLIMRCDTLDPACAPFFALAAEARMPIVYHTGSGNWDWNTDATRPSACAGLADRFPGLPILMAHCGVFGGSDDFEQAVSACEAHSNLYLETTAALLSVHRDRWLDALYRVGPSRIVYGNDYPWATIASVEEELAFLDSLGLTADERADILGSNLRDLWTAAHP